MGSPLGSFVDRGRARTGAGSSELGFLSERKGGAHKTERKNIKVDPETHAALLKYAQGHKIGMAIILAEFVAAGVEHDIHDADWAQKMVDELARVKFDRDPSRCPALAGVGKEEEINWRCVWYRDDRPPQIRKLGSTDAMMKKACLACGKTGEIIAGLKERDTRIHELETGLKARARELYKIPVCEGGAHLTPDATGFERCKRSNISVDILRFCKVVDDGPCAFFKETVVGVGEKT